LSLLILLCAVCDVCVLLSAVFCLIASPASAASILSPFSSSAAPYPPLRHHLLTCTLSPTGKGLDRFRISLGRLR
jgi:hypothetical protein